MKEKKLEVVVSHKSSLGEGPIWDMTKKRILWVDILQKKINWFTPDNGKYQKIKLKQMPGAVAVNSMGGLIVALEDGFYLINENNDLELIGRIEEKDKDLRFNDGKCDPTGRFWAGTMAISGKPEAGKLYMLDNDLSIAEKVSKVSCSNGLAWRTDHKKLFYIDSPTKTVVSFDYDLETGNIRNKKTVLEFHNEKGLPDGMTIDSEGMLWIAFFDGWKVERWNISTGKLKSRIRLPVSKVTSCTFGGKTLEDLYITTANVGLSSKELVEQPLAGSLFVIRGSGYTGVAPNEFKQNRNFKNN